MYFKIVSWVEKTASEHEYSTYAVCTALPQLISPTPLSSYDSTNTHELVYLPVSRQVAQAVDFNALYLGEGSCQEGGTNGS